MASVPRASIGPQGLSANALQVPEAVGFMDVGGGLRATSGLPGHVLGRLNGY